MVKQQQRLKDLIKKIEDGKKLRPIRNKSKAAAAATIIAWAQDSKGY